MKKNRMLPIVSFLLLVGAILLAAYFKSMEKKLEIEQNKTQNENSTINQSK